MLYTQAALCARTANLFGAATSWACQSASVSLLRDPPLKLFVVEGPLMSIANVNAVQTYN